MKQINASVFMPLIPLLLFLVMVSGCTRFDNEFGGEPDDVLETIFDNGGVAISYIVNNKLVVRSGRNADEFISELLAIELRNRNLCPDGYVIDRKLRFKNLDYRWILNCK